MQDLFIKEFGRRLSFFTIRHYLSVDSSVLFPGNESVHNGWRDPLDRIKVRSYTLTDLKPTARYIPV
jgi:hypothetical protein